ncbi:MAG TPA: hypothetical protein VGJ84_07405 [Polyangiaceae bacterium]
MALLRPALVVTPLLLLGCVTGGREWVRQPEPGGFENAPGELEWFDATSSRFDAAAREQPSQPRTHPAKARIEHTLSLGESFGSASQELTQAPTGASSIVIVAPEAASQWLWVGGFEDAPEANRNRGSAGIRPGQDWPAPPSFGPAFPYKVAPGSTLSPDR